MTLFTLCIIITLERKKIIGSILIAIFIVSVIGAFFGHNQLSSDVISTPPSIASTFMKMDLRGAFEPAMVSVIFAFFFVDLFDTAGTLIGISERAGLMKDGKIPNLKKALLADSVATVAGAIIGTSNTTSYVESSAGAAVGGRTGLMAVVVGVLFLSALFFSPVLSMVPSYATNGAILYVAVLMIMMYAIRDVNWEDVSEAAPVTISFLMIPLTYSIADGITMGFISYAILKVLTGEYKELNIGVLVLTAVLLARIIWL